MRASSKPARYNVANASDAGKPWGKPRSESRTLDRKWTRRLPALGSQLHAQSNCRGVDVLPRHKTP